MKRNSRLFILILVFVLSCSTRNMPPLEHSIAVLKPEVNLSALQRSAMDLNGTQADIQRLSLIDGQHGEILPLADGWLLQLHRGGENWQLWMAAAGQVQLLLRSSVNQLLDIHEDRALFYARDEGGRARVLIAKPGEDQKLLADAAADSFRMGAQRQLFWTLQDPANLFVYGPESWRLEDSQKILRRGKSWTLGERRAAETPFRVLHRFLVAARKKKWRQARTEVVLEKLLALPGGGHSRKLSASLKLTAPRLLDPLTRLIAPPHGNIHRLEQSNGRAAWRLRLEQQADSGWKIVELKTVL